ncbi:MAG: archease [Thermoleophilia bacterium]
MTAFEIVDHTADIGIRAFGSTEAEVFQNAATGMFSLIADLENVVETSDFLIEVEAEDRETLLVAWLNELLYLYDSNDMLLNRFELSELGETSLKGRAFGEPMDAKRHRLKTDIKAATYHMLRLTEESGRWQAEVIFDV